jgi:pyruvate dehydrogenase E2 component (dihydrolipoamide acetyltransferase)
VTATIARPVRTFLLPDLGEGLTDAEVVRWLVGVGDEVVVDQPVVEVETAKSMVEVPSPYDGTVATLHAPEGASVDVGRPLISVSVGATTDAAGRPEATAYREEERAGSGNVLIGYGTTENGASGRRRRRRSAAGAPTRLGPTKAGHDEAVPVVVPRVVSPLVRRHARAAGLDLHAVAGTGPSGLITRADVDAAAARSARAQSAAVPVTGASSPADRRIALNGFRRAVGAALSRSRAEIPEATVWVDVDATALWELRRDMRTPTVPGSGLLAYIARFTVAALRRYPVLNARLDTERQEIVEYHRINLGIAVQTDRGLLVPPVLDAQRLTTSGLDEAIRRVTATAREGRTPAHELAAGTFTLNNYGSFRVDGSTPIINHPQVAILGVGRIIDRPWVVDDQVCVRKITQLSFAFDHRVCDGGTAAGFLRTVADAMENPAAAIVGL